MPTSFAAARQRAQAPLSARAAPRRAATAADLR